MKEQIMLKNHIFEYYPSKTNEIKGLLSIPHSGELIPPEFDQYLSGNLEAYKEDVDYKVNELIDIEAIRNEGIAVIVANIHRVCVDLNRSPDLAVLNWPQNTKGVVLVKERPVFEIEQNIIARYHAPYFEMIKAVLKDLEKKKSAPVSFIDLHSMPSAPTEYHMKQNPNQKMSRADFCISDYRGKTCSKEFIHFYCDDLKAKNYQVAINDPYVGGYITIHVDQMYRTNNIQIEINRKIYMNETTKELDLNLVPNLVQDLTKTLISGFNKFDS
jgi:N-formylglutamate amidohydrolase